MCIGGGQPGQLELKVPPGSPAPRAAASGATVCQCVKREILHTAVSSRFKLLHSTRDGLGAHRGAIAAIPVVYNTATVSVVATAEAVIVAPTTVPVRTRQRAARRRGSSHTQERRLCEAVDQVLRTTCAAAAAGRRAVARGPAPAACALVRAGRVSVHVRRATAAVRGRPQVNDVIV